MDEHALDPKDEDEALPTMGDVSPVPGEPQKCASPAGQRETRSKRSLVEHVEPKDLLLVQTMVRDACLNTMGCYYVVRIGHFPYLRTIWSKEPWCVKFGLFLNRPRTKLLLISLSVLSMLCAVLEQPLDERLFGADRQACERVSQIVFFLTHSVFMVVFLLVLRCIWPTRKHWYQTDHELCSDAELEWQAIRPSEQNWTILFGVCLLISITFKFSWLIETKGTPWKNDDLVLHYKRNTVYGTIYSGVDVGVRVLRCVYLLYFSHSMRYAVISAFYLARKLGSILGLMAVFFLLHYFLFEAALPVINDTGPGPVDPYELRQIETYFNSTGDALFNMYVAMTTANHPDVWMYNYNAHWYAMVILISFMLVLNVFLLNVFLAVVTAEYGNLVQGYIVASNMKSEALLRTSFFILMHGHIDSTVLKGVQSGDALDMEFEDQFGALEKEKGISKAVFITSVQIMTQYFTLMEGSLGGLVRDADDKGELWYCLMDVNNDGCISLEEYEKDKLCRPEPLFGMMHILLEGSVYDLCAFWSQKRNRDVPQADDDATIKERNPIADVLESKSEVEMVPQGASVGDVELEESEPAEEPIYDQCVSEKFRVSSGQFPCPITLNVPPLGLNKYLTFILTHIRYKFVTNMLIIANIGLALFVFPDKKYQSDILNQQCGDTEHAVAMMFTVYFSTDVVVSALGQATTNEPWIYFWSKQANQSGFYYNWLDIAVVSMMWIDFVNLCLAGGSVDLTSGVSALRVMRLVRVIMHIKTFRIMFNATTRVIPAIIPQLVLFFISYYVFAIIGMTFLAGCVSEVTEDGGPGDWSTEPWSSTIFGQAQYYYNLSFDNMWAAYVTLFMLMIQNNWHVTVNGYAECTGSKWVRLYFLVYNFMQALLMINIFVGILLDMFALFWQDQLDVDKNEASVVESLYEVLCHRMTKIHNKDGILLADKWALDHEVTSEVLYSGIRPSDAVKLQSEVESKNEREGVRDIVYSMPFPVYCRTGQNKIAYCNRVFAGMYGMKPNEMNGSYFNLELTAELAGDTGGIYKQRDIKYNRLARAEDGCVYYQESGVLPDGSHVEFECVERPINLPQFVGKNTTVVHMYPASMDTTAFLDNNDGMLSPKGKLNIRKRAECDSLRVSNMLKNAAVPIDFDGDGVVDYLVMGHDKNGDGVPDILVDKDGDGVPDVFQKDEDGDGVHPPEAQL